MSNTILLKNANCDAMAWQPMEFSKYDGNRELEKYRNSLIYTITIHKLWDLVLCHYLCHLSNTAFVISISIVQQFKQSGLPLP